MYACLYGEEGPPQEPNVYALIPETGEIKWQFETSGAGGSAPRIANETLYVGEWGRTDGIEEEGNVYAIDAITGGEVWTTTVTGGPELTPAIANGRVYMGARGYGLHVLDATSGKKLWSKEIGLGAWLDDPSVQGDTVYLGGKHGMFALDVNTQETTWELNTPFAPGRGQVIDDTLYFGGGEIWAVDAQTGEAIWEFLPEELRGVGVGIVGDGTVYAVFLDEVPQTKAAVYALDAKTGEERWRYPIDSVVPLFPVVDDGVVYLPDEAGTVYRMDASTGDELSPFTVGSQAAIPNQEMIVISDGVLYMGNEAGTVFALDAKTGEQKWTTSLTGGILGL